MSGDFAGGGGGSWNSSAAWQRYVDVTFLAANCVILLGTSLVGIGANVFVTWAVYHQKSLRTWNNALLVNLAVVDLLRCAVDCPVILVVVLSVHRRGQAAAAICNLQMASFSFSCCIQLVTLACISAERYQAIAHPFKIAERKRRIVTFIPLTWALAIAVAAVCVTFVKDSPVYVKCQGSRFTSVYSDTFGLYILIPLWTACFALIIGFYASIFAMVTAHSRKIFDKGVNLPPKEARRGKATEETEGKKADETPASQTIKTRAADEGVVAQEGKVEHSKSNAANMNPTGAAQKETETVSVLNAPRHDEKVAEPTTETDKPPDESLKKPPKQPNPKETNPKEPKESNPKEPNPKEPKSKEPNPKEPNPKESNPKEPNPKEPNPKEPNPKEPNPKESNPKEPNPKEPNPKESNPKEPNPKESKPKEPNPKEPNPKESKPKAAKGDSGDRKTPARGQAAEVVSSKVDKTTPLVAHPVIQVQEQLSDRATESHPGTGRAPGKGRGEVQIQESKPAAPLTVDPGGGAVPPGPSGPPSMEPGGPDEPSALPPPMDLEQGSRKNEEAAGVVAVVSLAAVAPGDDQDLCMVPVARIPPREKKAAAAAAAAAADGEEAIGGVCIMPSKAGKDRGSKKKESKLAKRSGYIILTFLLFWLPLITTILVNVLVLQHRHTESTIIQDVEILFISIACMTSLTDPIIYAAVNPQFRTEFFRLRNKVKALWKKR